MLQSRLSRGALLLALSTSMPALAQPAPDTTLTRLERASAQFEGSMSSARSCTDAVQAVMLARTGKATVAEARSAFADDPLAADLLPVERACQNVRNTLSSGGGVDAQRARLANAIATRKRELETPSPAKQPDPIVSPLGLVGMAPIASEFDIMTRLQPSWGHGRPAPSNGTDPVGAFRMLCGAGLLKDVDNIVAFGKRSPHLHQIAGNEGTTETSTYRDLRTSGTSSCGNEANRTNYWMPALLNGKGQAVQPDYLLLYYKRRPVSDPKCQGFNDAVQAQGQCVPLPNGLRMIAGYDFATGKSAGLSFSCGSKNFKNLEDMQADPACTPDKDFIATIVFPSCWDGKNLDSPDHRSHMAYPGYGSRGWLKCPATHPYVIPRLEQKYHYTQAAGEVYSYSSDVQVPSALRGSTGHGDFFEAWDPTAKAMFEEHCLNKRLNCSGGDLGNGWQIRGATQPRYGWKNPNRLVDLSADPNQEHVH